MMPYKDKEKKVSSSEIIAKAKFVGINEQKISDVATLQRLLNQKKVVLFVSIFSDDFREPELDAMLSALYEKQAKVEVVVVDGIQGFNLCNNYNFSSASDEEIEKNVFPIGIEKANEWIRRTFPIFLKYNESKQFAKFELCLNKMKSIFQYYSQCKQIINQSLTDKTSLARQFQDALKQTIDLYLKNKPEQTSRETSKRYFELELPYYMALACQADYIAYTSAEPPAFKFVREHLTTNLLENGSRPAGYIEFNLTRDDPSRLPETSIRKIKQTGGVSNRYPNDIFSPQTSLTTPRPTLHKTDSLPDLRRVTNLYVKDDGGNRQRRRSRSAGDTPKPELKMLEEQPFSTATNPNGFFASTLPTPNISPNITSISILPPLSPTRKNGQVNPATQQVMMLILAGDFDSAMNLLVTKNGHIPSEVRTQLIQKITQMQLLTQLLPYEITEIHQPDEQPQVNGLST